MRDRLRLVLTHWIGVFLLIGTTVSARSQQVSIPALHATALNGDPVHLPDALHNGNRSKVAILVLGFSQSSRDQVSAWGKRLATDYTDSPSVLYYEMPVLTSVPRILRGFVTGRIKSSIPPRAHPRFVPIDEDEAAWKSAAAYTQSESEDAYILLVDSNGTVRFTLHGPPADAAYATLRDRLSSLTANLTAMH